jgi:hypothetical protein
MLAEWVPAGRPRRRPEKASRRAAHDLFDRYTRRMTGSAPNRPPIEGDPDFPRGVVRYVLTGSPRSSDVDRIAGFGPRDPRDADRPARWWSEGRLHARLGFFAATLFAGVAGWVPIGAAVATGHTSAIPVMLWHPSVALGTFVGTWALVVGTWFAVVPLVSWGVDGVELRRRPWHSPERFTPTEIEWHRGARYVGRYLVAHTDDGRRVRLPLWMLSRGGARRLFAFLDHHGRAPTPVPHSPP